MGSPSLRLACFLDHFICIDGEFRADHPAETTVDTQFDVLDFRGMVALGVVLLRDHQDLMRAVFNSEIAPLATLIENDDLAPRNGGLVHPEGLFSLPHAHGKTSLMDYLRVPRYFVVNCFFRTSGLE
jgi:hypothetical protein